MDSGLLTTGLHQDCLFIAIEQSLYIMPFVSVCPHVTSRLPPSSDYDQHGQNKEKVHSLAPAERQRTSTAADHAEFSA